MRLPFALAFALFALGVTSVAAAQVRVVEEDQVPDEQVVERGYVRGQGRGVQYGAHLASPFYMTDIRRAGYADGRPSPDRIPEAYGAGLLARIGWEFPLGFTIELFGGVAVSGFDTRGDPDTSNLLSRAEVGVGARYMIFNDTALVPFIGVGASARWFDLDWPNSADTRDPEIEWAVTGALHASIGAQIELSPYFGIELGLTAEYSFGADLFAEGLFALMPFVGVTLYVYDENDS